MWLLRAALLLAGQPQVYTRPEGQRRSLLASAGHSLLPRSTAMVLSLHAFKHTVSKSHYSMAFSSSGQLIQLFINDPGPHTAMRKAFQWIYVRSPAAGSEYLLS